MGSMDLGGASTQIAFAVQDDLKGQDYLRVKLYGYPYNVYTHSFLCYGKNEAGKLVLEKLVQVNDFFLCFFCEYAQKKKILSFTGLSYSQGTTRVVVLSLDCYALLCYRLSAVGTSGSLHACALRNPLMANLWND